LKIANAFTVLSDVMKAQELNNTEKLYLIEDFDKVFTLNLVEAESENQSTNVDEQNIEQLI
jgi:cysteinyl-tRNA synthetase